MHAHIIPAFQASSRSGIRVQWRAIQLRRCSPNLQLLHAVKVLLPSGKRHPNTLYLGELARQLQQQTFHQQDSLRFGCITDHEPLIANKPACFMHCKELGQAGYQTQGPLSPLLQKLRTSQHPHRIETTLHPLPHRHLPSLQVLKLYTIKK